MRNSEVCSRTIAAEEIEASIMAMGDAKQRQVLSRFFRCGPGQYGEGDRFLGVRVPQTRLTVRESRLQVALPEIGRLLMSEWHEVRLAGFLLLVEEMKAAMPRRNESPEAGGARRETLAGFYLAHARRANNWDLVDLSCPAMIGGWLLHPGADGAMPDRRILDSLAAKNNLWEQRIAVVSTLALIRQGQFDDTLRIVASLKGHPHDLIHKAMGWMLREVGKKDTDTLRRFLDGHCRTLPRTTLRYAIERLAESERQHWLKSR